MKIGKSAQKARKKETLTIPNFYALIKFCDKETIDLKLFVLLVITQFQLYLQTIESRKFYPARANGINCSLIELECLR